MQCAACKESIDDDSFFCDLCGSELLRCSQCGRIGKGKRCPLDGASMELLSASPTSAANPQAAAGAASVPSPALSSTANSAGRRLKLRCPVHNFELQPASGDVLGRRFGQHVSVLANFAQISSKHLEVRCDASGCWYAKDLDSFNHSYYNGHQLTPGEEKKLEAGATLALADIDLSVVFE